MLKALGIILIISSSVYYICMQICDKKKKVENLRQIKKAVSYLKYELAFSVPEMVSLCERTADKIDGDISIMFDAVGKRLKADSSIDFFCGWKAEQGERVLFSKQTQEAVQELFCDFGKKSLDIELDNLERTQRFLEEAEQEEEVKYRSERKLICTLGAAFCAAIVIIVI